MKLARNSIAVVLCLVALQVVTASQDRDRGAESSRQNRAAHRHQLARLLDPFGLWGHASQAVQGAVRGMGRTWREGASRVQDLVDRGSDNFRSLQSKIGAGFRSNEKTTTKSGENLSNKPMESTTSQQSPDYGEWPFKDSDNHVDFESSTSSATVNYLRQASDIEKPSSTWSMDQLPSTLSPHNPVDHPEVEDDLSVLQSLGNITQQLVEGEAPRRTSYINKNDKFERRIGSVDTIGRPQQEESGEEWLFGGLLERMGLDLPTIGGLVVNVIFFVVEALLTGLARDGGQSSRASPGEAGIGGRVMNHDADQEWSVTGLARDPALADRTIQLLQHASGNSTPCLQLLLCGLRPSLTGLQRALLPPPDKSRRAEAGDASLAERVYRQLPHAGQVARALDTCAEHYPACHRHQK